jgi:hypothetical protein
MDSLKLAQGLRGWQQKHPIADLGISFVPGVGQAYGLASAAAAMRDPEASTFEKGMAGASVLPVGKVADKLRKIVVGEKLIKGSASHEAALARAKEMLKEEWRKAPTVSKGPKATRDFDIGDPRLQDKLAKETGWWTDPDTGKWMTELDDSRSYPDYQYMDQAIQNKMLGEFPADSGNVNMIGLEDALKHPEMQKLPEARKMMSEVSVGHDPNLGRGGVYYGADDEMFFGSPVDPNPRNMTDVRDTLMHETQHAIASREGFARGSSPEAAGSYSAYLKDPGEILARTASLRRNMTPEARRKYPFHRNVEDYRTRLMDPMFATHSMKPEDLKRALALRNLDPEQMLVPGP